MTVNSVFGAASASTARTAGRGFDTLGQADFLRMLTVQIQQQDPFDPVDNKEMLAQMAQFSSLSGTTEMADTLSAISAKLDTLVTAQSATNQAVTSLAQKVAASADAATTA